MRQLTLNDCNIGTIFTLPKSGKRYTIAGFTEFAYEDTNEKVILLKLLHNGNVSYMPFETVIKKIITK